MHMNISFNMRHAPTRARHRRTGVEPCATHMCISRWGVHIQLLYSACVATHGSRSTERSAVEDVHRRDRALVRCWGSVVLLHRVVAWPSVWLWRGLLHCWLRRHQRGQSAVHPAPRRARVLSDRARHHVRSGKQRVPAPESSRALARHLARRPPPIVLVQGRGLLQPVPHRGVPPKS